MLKIKSLFILYSKVKTKTMSSTIQFTSFMRIYIYILKKIIAIPNI